MRAFAAVAATFLVHAALQHESAASRAAVAVSGPAAGDAPEALLASLREADIVLFRVFDRLATANAQLCDRKAGSAGMLVHSEAVYEGEMRAQARDFFGFEGPVAVEGVIDGGPAARAGVAQDDTIVAIEGVPLARPAYDRPALTALLREIGAAGADGTLSIGVRRNKVAQTFQIGTVPACAALIELRIAPGLKAGTDGDIIQVDSGLFNLVADEEAMLAAVVAHELAHVVLDHPGRLEAARVSRGLLRGFGRSGKLWRRTEAEADLLSVYLLANAGYDPGAAAAFWENYGRRLDSFLGLPTHQGWKKRARATAAEAAKVRAMAQRPAFPHWFVDRHTPLR